MTQAAPTGIAAPVPAADRPQRATSGIAYQQTERSADLDQIHRLNYDTFVREIPQHADYNRDAGRLVDKFHDRNTYFVARRGDEVIGMVAVHDRPPFSMESRLAEPGLIAGLCPRPLEVRLLAVRPAHRSSGIFAGLAWMVCDYARRAGYTHLLISGLREREPFYRRLGFSPLGPAVRSGQAWYVPMGMSLAAPSAAMRRDYDRVARRIVAHPGNAQPRAPRLISLLPGPVQLSAEVRAALARQPISHRSPVFVEQFEQVRGILRDLAGGLNVAIMAGSGTLANDAVAAALSADRRGGRGLILANGEFGERLATQAGRLSLDCQARRWPWGRPWRPEEVEAALDADPRIRWVWAVHLETSTGMLNDVQGLVGVCRPRGVRVCLDGVSALGAAPLDAGGIDLTSGVSGKSLGAVAGLCFVFASPEALDAVEWSRLPVYLDARAAIETAGARFTCASPVLAALNAALRRFATAELRVARLDHQERLGRRLRQALRDIGLPALVADEHAAPVVTTIPVGDLGRVDQAIAACRAAGVEVYGHSDYLRRRAWLQITTMGDVTEEDCLRAVEALSASASPTCDVCPPASSDCAVHSAMAPRAGGGTPA